MTNTDRLDQINDTLEILADAFEVDLTDDKLDDLTHAVARALGVTTGRACPMCGVDVPDTDEAVNQHYNDLHSDDEPTPPATRPQTGASDAEIHAQGMRRITITWTETTTYEQNFIVPADFNIDAAVEDETHTALEELIAEQADYNDVYSVDERDVTNVETDEGVSYPLD